MLLSFFSCFICMCCRKCTGFGFSLCWLWPHSHMKVLSGWDRRGVGELGAPLSSQPVCNLSHRSASPQSDGRLAGLIMASEWLVDCWPLSVFCSASIGHIPSIPLCHHSLFLLFCNVPVRAYRRVNNNRAELSDHNNCWIINTFSFWAVDSLLSGMSDNWKPFVYNSCFPLGIVYYTNSGHVLHLDFHILLVFSRTEWIRFLWK